MISLQINKALSFKKPVGIVSSKSISNRYLILGALSKNNIKIENLSNADDTKILQNVLNQEIDEINIGHAGTAMRFLLAYLSIKPGQFTLTGSKRMLERPIGHLVDAINELGGDIKYLSRKGYPPVKIHGKNFKGGNIALNSSVSSQYISAILLIAPFLENGISLQLKNNTVSFSYIKMTLKILNEIGIKTLVNDQMIRVLPNRIKNQKVYVEGDWSSASYWFSIIALSSVGSKMSLVGLNKDSLQGDQRIIDIMKHFGVESVFDENILKIIKAKVHKKEFEYDFINCPDIAQTIMVAGAALNMKIKFKGLQTLKLKESDRVKAMNTELMKFGYSIKKNNESWLLDGEFKFNDVSIETYNDHRIAMSFAPLVLKNKKIKICDPKVINKSYPDFWGDLEGIGLRVENIT